MDAVCCRVGGFPIHWYGVFAALGFLSALATWTWLGRRDRRSADFASDLMIWVMAGGILGARLAYVFSESAYFLQNPLKIIRIDEGGLIYYGGFLGALAALWIFARRRRAPFVGVLDFVAVALPLGHAFGRIGCFLNGCCYGRPTGSVLGFVYPVGSAPWKDQATQGLIVTQDLRALPVEPVQLYEAAVNLLVYALLVVVYRRRPRAGLCAALYLVFYPLTRFVLEFLRGDPRMREWGLSVAQWISIGLFAAGVISLAVLARPARIQKGEPA